MIILDTNVISELMKTEPNAQVQQWLRQQNSNQLFLTTITVAEIQRGVIRLPVGKRRNTLAKNFGLFLNTAFSGRILPFCVASALNYGATTANREKSGKHVDAVDMMIAAIALTKGFKIATRNIKDFDRCGVTLIDPWQAFDFPPPTRHG